MPASCSKDGLLDPDRGLSLEIIKRNAPAFKILPKRWVVERL